MTVALRLAALVSALDLSLRQQEAHHAEAADILLQAILIRRRLSTRTFRKLWQIDSGRAVKVTKGPAVIPTLGDLIETERRIAGHIDQLLPSIVSSGDLMEAILQLRAEVDEAALSLQLIQTRRSPSNNNGSAS